MIPKIDQNWLIENGILVSVDEGKKLVNKITSELEYRVGDVLSRALTTEEILDFEKLLDANVDETTKIKFLEDHVPDYRVIVEAELKRLTLEITGVKDKALYIMSLPHA